MEFWVFLYFIVGLARSAYLLSAGRIEGRLYEFSFHTILWPLDVVIWLERQWIKHRS